MMSKVGPKEILMQKQIIRFFQKELDYSTFLSRDKNPAEKDRKGLDRANGLFYNLQA
jgi:hypothetical protein